jgi:hypothetical protein
MISRDDRVAKATALQGLRDQGLRSQILILRDEYTPGR